MDLNWHKKLFNQNMCNGSIVNEGKGDLLITGTIKTNIKDAELTYWAPTPANHGASFSGSGLPYPNPEVAYDRTPNVGRVALNSKGEFSIRIKYPNAYYSALGTGYIPPIINLKVCGEEQTTTIKIDDGIPFRSLTYLKPHTVESYIVPPKIVRTQEEILRSSAYPSENKMPENLWGMKPPL